MERPKRTRIEPVHVEEANRLRALYNAKVTVSQEAFGAEHGIGSQGMVWQYLNHRSPLNLEAALKFARALECSVADFSPRLAEALGAGDASPSASQRSPSSSDRRSRSVEVSPGDNRLPIRRVRFKISAGISGYEIEYDEGDGESEPIFMARRWFEQHRYRHDRLLAVKVSGRSMEPSLYDGDLVIVNLDDTRLQDGQVFAANYDGELVIKRLKREVGSWFLASDSLDKVRFPDKRCSDGCGLIGRVVYKQSEHI